MNGNSALLDSNIIIYLSKRELPLTFLDQFDEHFISVIYYEYKRFVGGKKWNRTKSHLK